jgi:MFS family permease
MVHERGRMQSQLTILLGFYLNLPIGGLAAAILLCFRFPEATKKEAFSLGLLRKVLPELDLIGFLLFVPPSVMFLLALQFGSGNKYPWNSATIIGLICGAVVLALIFIFWERHMGDRAMLPGSLLKRKIIWTSCVHSVCNISCVIVASNWLPTYFQAVKGDEPTMSGVHVLPSIGGQMTFVLMSGALGKIRIEHR